MYFTLSTDFVKFFLLFFYRYSIIFLIDVIGKIRLTVVFESI